MGQPGTTAASAPADRRVEKDGGSFDPRLVPKIGTSLAREWRGRSHVVLVREDGFEYEGQPYRSLSVIAERITGAHWTKRPGDR